MDRGFEAGGSARQRAAELRAEAEHYEKGAAGEQATGDALALLPPEFQVFHDLVVPGSVKANVDHLVIGPTGVWLIDSKASDYDIRHSDGTLWRGKYPMRREIARLEEMADQVSRHLDADVFPVLCFTHGQLRLPCPRIGRVTPVNLWQLLDLVRRGPTVASSASVEWWSRLATEMKEPIPAPPSRPSEVLAEPQTWGPEESPRPRRRRTAAPATKSPRRDSRPAARAASKRAAPALKRGRSSRRRRESGLVELFFRIVLGLLLIGFLLNFIDNLAEQSQDQTSQLGAAAPGAPERLLPPQVVLQVSCPIRGAGYRVTPNWPGDVQGLSGYRVRLETGLVGEMGLWTKKWAVHELKPLYRLPPGIPIEVSMVAEMADGRRSPEGRGRVDLPPEPC